MFPAMARSLPYSGAVKVHHKRIGSWPYSQTSVWLLRLAGINRSSLFAQSISNEEKSFIRMIKGRPELQVSMISNFLPFSQTTRQHKLECFCMELLLKWKAQYSSPPWFRSAAFDNANVIFYLQNKPY